MIKVSGENTKLPPSLPFQRDRSIIKDLLVEIDRYSARNLQKRDEKLEAERRRQHEAQHAQLCGSTEEEKGTAGEMEKQETEEEEKEVDPSIVGSLDDVYKDEPGADMKEEDPFKKVPMMDDHDKPSSMKEMEKTVDAMVALVEHAPDSPVPEDATSLDRSLRSNPTSPPSADQLPDLVGTTAHNVGSSAESGREETLSSSSNASIPLDLAVGAQRSLDLLDEASEGSKTSPTSSQPIDLTKGLEAALKL